jgi:hypothetical protein
MLRPLSALSLDEGLNALSDKNLLGCWLVQPTNQMSVIVPHTLQKYMLDVYCDILANLD